MKKTNFLSQTLGMFVWSIAYRIMCLVVSVSLIAIVNNKIGVVLSQMFSLAIFLVLPYIRMYDLGSKDLNRINYGRIKRDDLKGLKIGAIIALPYAVCGILLVLAHFGAIDPAYQSVYRMINSPYFSLCQTILPPTLTVSEQSLFAIIVAVLTVLTEPVVYGLGYRMGLARISFTGEMGIRVGKKAKAAKSEQE